MSRLSVSHSGSQHEFLEERKTAPVRKKDKNKSLYKNLNAIKGRGISTIAQNNG